jgi:hypothetical protein
MTALKPISANDRGHAVVPFIDRTVVRSTPTSWPLAAAAYLARAVRISGRKAISQEFSYG